jgi:ribosomal protein S6
MSEIINQYETIFVVDAALEEETIAGIVDKFKTLIGEAGEIESVDEWGKRRLAYPIDYKTEGYYVLINFSAKPDFPLELERIYNITDGLLRSITVRKIEKKARS